MEVYHTSSVVVERPNVQFSRPYLDFGAGFYVTTMCEQAIKYGARFILRGKDAILNTYELQDDLNNWKVRKFAKYDGTWLDFVAECRLGKNVGDYDIVVGGIANDKVFRTVDLFFAGEISKDECLKRLVFEQPNNQICIRNQQVIEESLTFKCSRIL